eukprot:GHUV01019928.1.p1 GENE.GHUV01019928.1~~GHUV01019928.1.p1  ORF type:complete len:147 (+),score=12.28 GHUV01019928.1:566-1006(+)
MDGLAPFTDQPTAVVATAEKRIQTVQVTLHSEGGHSSRPPIDGSSIGDQLAQLLTATRRNPPRPRLIRPATDFLKAMIPLSSGIYRLSISTLLFMVFGFLCVCANARCCVALWLWVVVLLRIDGFHFCLLPYAAINRTQSSSGLPV